MSGSAPGPFGGQVQTSPEERIRPELAAGEHVVWAGRPSPRFDAVRHGPTPLLFAVLWLGFAGFWEVQAVRAWRSEGGPFFFVLFGAGFFLLGLNGMFGYQLRALRRLRSTTYGVTDRRLLFVYEGRAGRNVESLDLDRIGAVEQNVRTDGTGSLVFEQPGTFARYTGTAMRTSWSANGTIPVIPIHAFIDIADAATVARLIEEQRNRAAPS